MSQRAASNDKYEQEQRRFWRQLHQKLIQYKEELEATHTELAQCLGISRQPLVSFMQDPDHGLPIRRANLERLWDLLTDPEHVRDKHLSANARSRRNDLRQEGPDALLSAAGFLPNATEPRLEIDPSRYQQIQRVVFRLSTLPVTDFADFIKIIGSIEASIASAFPSKDLNTPSEGLAETWIERWIRHNSFSHAAGLEVKDKFKAAINQLSISGKYELANSEMFDLYISVLENEKLSKSINEALKMRITQCQFKTLTRSVKEYIAGNNSKIQDKLTEAELDAERQLRMASHDTSCSELNTYLQDAVADVVIEATIVCNFRNQGDNVCWRYSSSTTHFENMLAAMARGMGYESELKLVDFSIRSLGSKDYSLVKTSTAFKNIQEELHYKGDKTYQGVWVDRSAVLGILQSGVMALGPWLNEKFSDSTSCHNYHQVCKAVAAIDDSLTKGRMVLNGYRIQHAHSPDGRSSNDCLEKEVIEKIEELEAGLLKATPALRRLYSADLTRKYCMAKLSCAHSALIEGNMVTARELLQDTKDYLKQTGEQNISLQTLYLAESKLYQFFSGDRALFSKQATWRSELNSSLKELSQYIYKSQNHCGRFDADIYMIAAELFGRIGRLNFCICGSEPAKQLEASVHTFLQAAYCSAKIGHKQRAAHWISNASRACCRLGLEEQARAFSHLSENMIDRAVEPIYSPEYREAIMAEVNLAHGERLLLIEQNPSEAIAYFLKSLKGSIYIGFVRLIADSLYNLARASRLLQNDELKKSFDAAFGGESKNFQSDWQLRENEQGWRENQISAEVIKFLNCLSREADWNSASDQFQQEANSIWNRLANSGTLNGKLKHPIEDEIASYRFLDRVK